MDRKGKTSRERNNHKPSTKCLQWKEKVINGVQVEVVDDFEPVVIKWKDKKETPEDKK